MAKAQMSPVTYTGLSTVVDGSERMVMCLYNVEHIMAITIMIIWLDYVIK